MTTRLEDTKYDRPSLHSSDAATRAIGRLTAAIDRHIQEEHEDHWHELQETMEWSNFTCEVCGFDVRAELYAIYPDMRTPGILAMGIQACRYCYEITTLQTCPSCGHRTDRPINACDCMICEGMRAIAGGWLDAWRLHEEAFATMTEPMDHLVYEHAAQASQLVPSLTAQLPLEAYHAIYSVCARIATVAAAGFTDNEPLRRRLVHFLIRMLLLGFGIGHEVVAEHGSLKRERHVEP